MSTHSQLDEILSLVWYVTFPKRYSINDCILSKPVKAVTYFILKGGLLWKQETHENIRLGFAGYIWIVI